VGVRPRGRQWRHTQRFASSKLGRDTDRQLPRDVGFKQWRGKRRMRRGGRGVMGVRVAWLALGGAMI